MPKEHRHEDIEVLAVTRRRQALLVLRRVDREVREGIREVGGHELRAPFGGWPFPCPVPLQQLRFQRLEVGRHGVHILGAREDDALRAPSSLVRPGGERVNDDPVLDRAIRLGLL